ncbi:MAG: hypothetical protein LBP22_02405, partial [Deltaproteobacteria bacterium]|nr:hypothetical protein [Deltaproteobacteria bacterium]
DLAQAKLREDTESRRLQNERARLKLELEQGRLIARDQVGRELAARIAFFKRELETLWVLTGPKVLALLKGDPAKLPDLNSWWKKTVAEWLDIWSQDRSYADESEPEPRAAGPLGKAGGRAKPLTGPSGGTVPGR